MYRGTTPTLVFELPFAASDLTAVHLAVCQDGELALEKALADCTADGETLSVTLTEAETLSLKSGSAAELQLRCACGETRLCSKVFRVPVERILKDGALA